MKNRITFFLTKLKNHRKVTTVLIILFMYLFIWMFFGFLYFKIANSDKSAFNFDNGIKQYYDTETINLQAKEFINKINASQKNFNITKYDNKAVMDLIKNNDLDTAIFRIYDKNGNYLYENEFNKSIIGETWANWLYYKIDNNLSSAACVLKVDDVIKSNQISYYNPTSLDDFEMGDISEITLSFYFAYNGAHPFDTIYLLSDEEVDPNNFKYKIKAWIRSEDLNKYMKSNSSSPKLNGLLKYLIDYEGLASDYDILSNVLDVKEQYYFVDFLYFSAVTITTTGYGDILPNNSTVRFLVMIESLCGVMLPGAFISALFMKMNKKKRSN